MCLQHCFSCGMVRNNFHLVEEMRVFNIEMRCFNVNKYEFLKCYEMQLSQF